MQNKIITYFLALVWLVNGLFCKVLHGVPRHEAIVNRIVGSYYSKELTIVIGLLEIVMFLWILSKFKSILNAIMQIIIVMTMNIIEFIQAPDLLLWGRFNMVFALIFSIIVYWNEFKLNSKRSQRCSQN